MSVNRERARSASTYEVMLVQESLRVAGLYDGPIDGVPGAGTKLAVRAWRRRHGLPVSDALDADLVAAMRAHI